MKAYTTILITSLFVPLFAFAQPRNFADFAGIIINIGNNLALLFITAAFAAFLWGVARTILHADNADEREKGKKTMAYGLVSLFIVSALWGIMALTRNTFFFSSGSSNSGGSRCTSLLCLNISL
ncbi:MAG: hypothetical protein NUV42_02345 [Candidatus Yonathbacteria bacterium]|nr:hypothetical protein [Candidatus Yonathbacteria bacterium]